MPAAKNTRKPTPEEMLAMAEAQKRALEIDLLKRQIAATKAQRNKDRSVSGCLNIGCLVLSIPMLIAIAIAIAGAVK